MAIGISTGTGHSCKPAGGTQARTADAASAARKAAQAAAITAAQRGGALAGGRQGGALDSIISGIGNLGGTGGVLPRGAGAPAAAAAPRTDFATRFGTTGMNAADQALLQGAYDKLMSSPTGAKIMSDFSRSNTKIRVVDDAAFSREHGNTTMGVFMQTKNGGATERVIELPKKVLSSPSLGPIILGHEALHANQAQRGAQMGDAAEPEAYDAQEAIARELGVPSPPRPAQYR